MKIVWITLLLVVSLVAQETKDSKNIDFDTPVDNETKDSLQKWAESSFNLEPYKVNYILPYAYAFDEYSVTIPFAKYKQTEAQLQISLKLKVGEDWLGLDESYYLAYSHKAFWQIYAYSSPFRETNYNPEAFVVFPVTEDTGDFHLRSIKVAFAHISNGEPDTSSEDINGVEFENISRGLNYIYTAATLQHSFAYGILVSEWTLRAPVLLNSGTSENDDIMDYYGYTKVKFSYFHKKHLATLMLMGNPVEGHGAMQMTYSYPIFDSFINLYGSFFTGYGESLIDYNHDVTKVAVGFSFSH